VYLLKNRVTINIFINAVTNHMQINHDSVYDIIYSKFGFRKISASRCNAYVVDRKLFLKGINNIMQRWIKCVEKQDV